jgi:predicted transcriptional regulator
MPLTLLSGSNEVVSLDLSSLRDLDTVGFHDGRLPLRDTDKEHIEHLVASDLLDIPPITVVHTTEGYVIVDGYHRVEAAKILHMQIIPALIQSYQTEEDVIEAAFQANLKHGLPADHKIRGEYACWLHDTYEIPQVEIAKRVGMSQPTVSRILRKKQQEEDQAVQDQENYTEDERAYQTNQTDYTKRLVQALSKFYDHECAFLGSASGTRSETKRAKALVQQVKPDIKIAEMYDSLSRSLNQAAALIRQRAQNQPSHQHSGRK